MIATRCYTAGMGLNTTLMHGLQSIWGLTHDNGDRFHGLYNYIGGCAVDSPDVNESGYIKANVDDTGRFAYFRRLTDFENKLKSLIG